MIQVEKRGLQDILIFSERRRTKPDREMHEMGSLFDFFVVAVVDFIEM